MPESSIYALIPVVLSKSEPLIASIDFLDDFAIYIIVEHLDVEFWVVERSEKNTS